VLVPRDCIHLRIFTPSQDCSHESSSYSFINEHTQSSTNHFWWYIIRIWYIALKLIIHINASVQQLCLLDISLLWLMAWAAPYSTLMTFLSVCCLTVHHATLLCSFFKRKPKLNSAHHCIKQNCGSHQNAWYDWPHFVREVRMSEKRVLRIFALNGAEVAEGFRKIHENFAICYFLASIILVDQTV